MRYVIAGAGPAGISAAKTLRQLDRDGEIVLVSKDDQVHSRCMLHKYLGGTSSQVSATTPRSWVIKIMEVLSLFFRFSIISRTCACMVTSRAVWRICG